MFLSQLLNSAICSVKAAIQNRYSNKPGSYTHRWQAGFDPQALVCQPPPYIIMTLCVYFPESHPYLCVTVFSVFKRVPVTGDRKVGGRRARKRKNLTLRTRSLASMRRQCPAFVPLSTSICSQRENEQKPWITWQHKGQQLCKSIHRWNSSPKGKGIIYKIGMVTLKEGQRNLCRRKKWSRTKTSSNVEKGKHKKLWSCFKTWREKGMSTHQKITCFAPQGLDHLSTVSLAGQFT